MRLRPRLFAVQEPDASRCPVDVRGRRLGVQGARQHTVPQGEHRLDDTGDPRRCLRVPEVRLHGPQPQRPLGGPVLAVRRQQRVDLDGIPEPRPRPMRLYGVHVVRRETRVGEGLPDDALLGGTAGRGQAVGGAVLVDGGAADDGEDAVAVAPGVGEPFQQEHADALGHGGPVGAVGERLAAAVRGQAALPGELHQRPGAGHDGRPARQREVAFAAAQRPYRLVQCHQRRRARRVHGDRRPLQAQREREAPRQHALRRTRTEVTAEIGDPVHHRRDVVLAVGADEHSGVAAAQPGRVDRRVLQRLPRHFEEQPLLRVHGQGLARRDPEEPGVEIARRGQEPALPHIRRPGRRRIGVVERVQVPAPVGGQRADRVRAGGQQPPQVLG